MKISVIADCHLNKAVYKGIPDKNIPDLPFRNVDFMNAFEYMVDENINNIKPDLVVIAGDVYDSFDPSNIVRSFFNNQVRKLTVAKIPIIILTGNHDICRRHHALKPIASLGLNTVKVIESPKIISFKDSILALFPYSVEVERGDITIKEQFYNFTKEINDKIKSDSSLKGKEVLFFGHFGVKGASLNQYVEDSFEDILTNATTTPTAQKVILTKKEFTNSNDKDINLSDLDSIGAKYVFLGDYHRHQILDTKKCIAMYTGSIEKSNLTEISQEKGFILYDTEAKESGKLGKCKFIQYPNCRPMLQLKGTMHDIETQFNDSDKKKLNGAIVKMIFVGNNDELTTFSIKMEPFKKKLRAEIDPIHIYHEQKVIDEIQENEATALEAEILERGHLESDDVLGVVEEMIKERNEDNKEVNELMKLATDIYKEAMMGDK